MAWLDPAAENIFFSCVARGAKGFLVQYVENVQRWYRNLHYIACGLKWRGGFSGLGLMQRRLHPYAISLSRLLCR